MKEEPAASGTLAHRTVTAAQWRMASSVVQGGLQFGVSVLLARLLPPEDFGLVALAFVVVTFATMVADLGLGPAVVQRRDLTGRHLRVAFTTSVLMGLVVAALIYLAAPLAAPLLRAPQLPDVLRWEALLFVFAGFGATARGLLQRALDFRRLFVIDLVSYGIGYAGVAVVMALMGFGVWSLVAGAVMQSMLGALLALGMARHPVAPLLARPELRHLLGYGIGASLNRIVNYVARNGDNVAIGRWLGAYQLGLYSRAYHLMTLPLGYVGSVTWNILFSAFSEIQDERERMGRAYLKGIQLTTIVGAPVMAGMVVAAPHLIVGLYGKQWAGAALPLQILCAVGVLQAIYHAGGAVTHATGHVYAELRRQALYSALVVVGALVGLRWGITGVAVGVALAIVGMYLAMAQLSLRITRCRWRDFFSAQLPGVVVAGMVACSALLVRVLLERQGVSSVWILLAIIAACAAAVPLGIYLLPSFARPVGLFHSIEGQISRLPSPVRLPVRRVLRLSAERAHAL